MLLSDDPINGGRDVGRADTCCGVLIWCYG